MRSRKKTALVTALMVCAAGASVHADDRKFTYSYEAKTLPQGTWEFEQSATLQTQKEAGIWNGLLLREEIEYGVTDRLNGSIYLNTLYQGNSGVPGTPSERSFGFDSMSTEWKYKLTEPAVDWVGILLYEELAFSNVKYEVETKLVLSKEIGPWTFAYNFVYEAELNQADDPQQSPQWTWEHELFNTVGISYAFTPEVAIGVEAYDVARYDVFRHDSTRADYAGPNLHVSSGSWWATLTVLHQVSFGRGYEVTDDDNTKWSFRIIFGVTF